MITKSGTSRFHGTAYSYLRNNKFDAREFDQMAGDSHLVQNQFSASLGGPAFGRKTFFFTNYEGFRQTQNMTMMDTVPSMEESGGDFSNAGTAIFDPRQSHANANYDAGRPISPSNPQIIRTPFPRNTIPDSRINRVASIMQQNYVPAPNMMGDMGMNMTMMGQPLVFGSGSDSSDYMNVRAMRHSDNQCTVRLDHVTLPGPGLLQPRRPHPTASFIDGTVFPAGIQVASSTFPVSTVNLLEDTARSWYDAGYVNLRRRYARGLSLPANYTFAKNLSDAPDFRSPMFESSVQQNNSNLNAEKGPACDIRHRVSSRLRFRFSATRRIRGPS